MTVVGGAVDDVADVDVAGPVVVLVVDELVVVARSVVVVARTRRGAVVLVVDVVVDVVAGVTVSTQKVSGAQPTNVNITSNKTDRQFTLST